MKEPWGHPVHIWAPAAPEGWGFKPCIHDHGAVRVLDMLFPTQPECDAFIVELMEAAAAEENRT